MNSTQYPRCDLTNDFHSAEQTLSVCTSASQHHVHFSQSVDGFSAAPTGIRKQFPSTWQYESQCGP